MNLLKGRHIVFLSAYEELVDEWGVRTREPSSQPPHEVRCTVQWQEASETVGAVPQPDTAVKVIALEWPGKPNDHFTWDGREFEQVGPARLHNGSPLVRHYEILARLVADE